MLLGEAKVVGSAQRRQRGALLQHGAIVLEASPAAPAVAGVKDITGRTVAVPELIEAVTQEFRQETRWEVVPVGWEPAELQRLEELVAGKYLQVAWNEKR